MQANLTRAQIFSIASQVILRWAECQPNQHAAALALLRLDDTLDEIERGKPLGQALRDNFNDRLLTRLEIALS